MAFAIIANGALGAALSEALNDAGLACSLLPAPPAAHLASTLVVIALENAPLAEVLDHLRHCFALGLPVLVVSVEGANVVFGPLAVPGVSACLECRLRGSEAGAEPSALLAALARRRVGEAARLSPATLASAASAVADLLRSLDAPQPARRAFSAAHVLGDEHAYALPVMPRGDCVSCRTAVEHDGPLARAALADVAVQLELEGFAAELGYNPSRAPQDDAYRRVGIIGGGTAGFLTALALRARLPELEVTLVESSKIPIISVGEATTPDMVKFLHAPSQLGIDIVDFHRAVLPTLKLGIRFLWGEDPQGFSYPFQYAPLVDAARHDGALDNQSVASLLMGHDRAPLLDDGQGGLLSLLESLRFAYHLDNERFVHFLHDEARRRGVTLLDATVAEVVTTPDGEEIERLVTDDGRELRFDLYVDATGFRSLLLEQALRSPFKSYAESLFTDSAIAANVPHDGVVKPYTQARTMDAGWCWTIPFEAADHIGYVYSSAFLSADAALAEMRRVHPAMGEPRQVRFRSGRHEHFFKGNVVAVGNAYAFVEPLESTALHMLIFELEHLTNHFPRRHDTATKARLGERVNEVWDQLRWFLAAHYRYNRRLDTPFWRAARADADVSGARARLELFAEQAPLSDRPSLFYSVFAPDFFAGDHAFDTLLMGQRVPARLGSARLDADAWQRRVALRRKTALAALGQAEALPLLREQRPDLLRRFISSPDSWVHHWVAR